MCGKHVAIEPGGNLITALLAVIFALHALFVIRQGVTSFSRWLTSGVLVWLSVVQIVRLSTSFIWAPGENILSASQHHALFIANFSVSMLLFSVGAVLMAGDRLRAELEHLATRDSLTGMLTRRYMEEACAAELVRARRLGQPATVLMMDLIVFQLYL